MRKTRAVYFFVREGRGGGRVRVVANLTRDMLIKVEQKIGESTQNASVRKRKRQPQFLETSRLESARSLHTERTHSRAKETAETA